MASSREERDQFISLLQLGQVGGSSCSSDLLSLSTMALPLMLNAHGSLEPVSRPGQVHFRHVHFRQMHFRLELLLPRTRSGTGMGRIGTADSFCRCAYRVRAWLWRCARRCCTPVVAARAGVVDPALRRPEAYSCTRPSLCGAASSGDGGTRSKRRILKDLFRTGWKSEWGPGLAEKEHIANREQMWYEYSTTKSSRFSAVCPARIRHKEPPYVRSRPAYCRRFFHG